MNPQSQLGLCNPRLCLAVVLCLLGALLGVASITVPAPPLSSKRSVKDTPATNAPPASVTITEFSDFQCPYCKRAASVVEQVRQSYGERVKIIFKQMPLSFHQYAFKAAQASVCAQERGKFWQYHDRLFASADLSVDALHRIAAEVGLKQKEFSQCMASNSSRAAVEKDMHAARQLGVRGTPTFFIEGKKVVGAPSFEGFKRGIDQQMIRAQNTEARPIDLTAGREKRQSFRDIRNGKGQNSVWAIIASAKQPLSLLLATLTKTPTLSINDVTLTEDSCQNKAFVFTVTLSKLANKPVTVNYATSDGSPGGMGAVAMGGKDYVPVQGTLTFTHDTATEGANGTYLLTITVPLGNYVVSNVVTGNDGREFTVTLSGATNASISKAQGAGTLLNAATSCVPTENAVCFVNYCGATRSCRQINRSTCAEPICQIEGIGTSSGSPDPEFTQCGPARVGGVGLWVNTSGDGISDAAKAQGYIDMNCDGTFDPGTDIPLPQADPNRADVYLHYDYMVASDHDHNPPAAAIQWMVDAFAAHGVALHIDPVHNAIPEAGQKVVTNQTFGPPNWAIDPTCAGDASTGGAVSMHALAQEYLGNLAPVYHYMVFAHFSTCPDATHCSTCSPASEGNCVSGGNTSPPFANAFGDAEVNGDHAMVSLGAFVDAGVAIPLETWAGVTMHELGHNLGLVHGGITSSGADCTNQKPNYISVMNYSFASAGIPVAAAPGDVTPKSCLTDADCTAPAHCSGPTGSIPNTCVRIDYSSALLPPESSPVPHSLNENHLDETVGLNVSAASTDLTVFYTNGGITQVFAPTNGSPIDWNQDGSIETDVCADISGTSTNSCPSLPTLFGANDWATQPNGTLAILNFAFQCTTNYDLRSPGFICGQNVCSAGQVCVSGLCHNLCGRPGDPPCPAGQTCVNGECQ